MAAGSLHLAMLCCRIFDRYRAGCAVRNLHRAVREFYFLVSDCLSLQDAAVPATCYEISVALE